MRKISPSTPFVLFPPFTLFAVYVVVKAHLYACMGCAYTSKLVSSASFFATVLLGSLFAVVQLC